MACFVCDTNVWYGIHSGTVDPTALKRSGHTLLACMINFVELVGGMEPSSFERRRGAVRAVQAWADDYLPENERHLAALWGHPAGATMSDWRRAFQTVAEAPNLPSLWRGYRNRLGEHVRVGMHTLTSERPQRYRQFVAEVESVCERVQPGFRAARAAGKVHLVGKEKRRDIEALLNAPAFLDRLALATRSRVVDSFPAPSEPTAEEFAAARASLDPYVRVYAAYIAYSAAEAPPDRNDLGDCEFFLYLQDGRQFFTKETRWHRVAALAGMEHMIVAQPSGSAASSPHP